MSQRVLSSEAISCALVTAATIDAATDTDVFVTFIRDALCPALRPGQVVVMDNLACHKRAGVREAVEEAGAFLLYLPAYSPDLSPIELAFAKLKRLLRSAGMRTVDGLWAFLGRALDAFGPEECRNYFRHCGYPATDG